MSGAVGFALTTLLLAGFVVLGGTDLGAGILYFAIARGEPERRQVLSAIGPVWRGNELWLLAAGLLLLLAGPAVAIAALSGFSPLLVPLAVLLVLRIVALELARPRGSEGSRPRDFALALASALVATLLGAALGNVLRGVPLDRFGAFALPLFGSFRPHGAPGLVDGYTLLVGGVALVALAHHGALYLAWRGSGRVRPRGRRWATLLFPVTVIAWVGATAATADVAPNVFAGFDAKPLVWLTSLLLVGGLATSFAGRRLGHELVAFLGSSAFLFGTLAAIAASLYPTWLPSSVDPELALTAGDAASSATALVEALRWWPAGLALAFLYLGALLRLSRRRARAAAGGAAA